jgi:Sigma-70, region 4
MSTDRPKLLPDSQHQGAAWNELGAVLHEEVRQLPDKYRVPVILSYLGGKTNEEVAKILHWPVGCVKGRLARARSLLLSRLTRRGMGLSAAFLLTDLADGAVFAEVVPTDLIDQTLLMVRELNIRGASSSPSTFARIPRESGIRHRITALANDAALHPKSPFGLLAFLIASTAIGFGTALLASGNSPFLRSIFSSLFGAQSSCATDCQVTVSTNVHINRRAAE